MVDDDRVIDFRQLNCLVKFQLYSGFSAEDRGISQVMMHYVANFVKSGYVAQKAYRKSMNLFIINALHFYSDPSKPNSMQKSFPMGDAFHATAWPQFDEPNREAYLEISTCI